MTDDKAALLDDVEAIAKHVYAAMCWAIQNRPVGNKTPDWQPHGNSFAQQRAREAARAIAALSPRTEGWVMVPRYEMTDDMMNAAQAYLDGKVLALSGRFHLPGGFNWHEFWNAMIAAAAPAEQP